jgi:hypothetical protein
VEVHVLVGVGMGEAEAGGGEGGELGLDLGGELAADAGAGEVGEAAAELVRGKLAGLGDEIGDLGVRKDGGTLDDDEVEADAQGGEGAGAADGVGGGGGGDHEAGGVQYAGTVGDFDGFVDGRGEAEIVGGESKPI